MAEKTFTQDQLNEKVAAAVEKAVAKATKEETKRCLDIVKEAGVSAKELEDKGIKGVVLGVLKEIAAEIKG